MLEIAVDEGLADRVVETIGDASRTAYTANSQ